MCAWGTGPESTFYREVEQFVCKITGMTWQSTEARSPSRALDVESREIPRALGENAQLRDAALGKDADVQ
jgi:hypothetical protein